MSRSTRRDSILSHPSQSATDASVRRVEPNGTSADERDSTALRAEAFFRDEGDPEGLVTVYCTVCGPDLPGAAPGALLDARGYACAGCGTLLLMH